MSYMQETMKCVSCGYYFNVALGTFGGGMPLVCPNEVCEETDYEHIGAGWGAENDGTLIPTPPLKDTTERV